MKRAIIVHGWDGNPNNHWFPWLKNKLNEKGFEVHTPFMPGGENPKLEEWLQVISDIVGKADKDTYFIGHSLGCITIVKYLESLAKNTKIGGCIFVAGFSFSQFKEIKDFYRRNFDINKVKEHCDNFTCIYSDNDKGISVKVSEEFADLLEARKILLKGKGHFTKDDGVTELSSALKELLEMSE